MKKNLTVTILLLVLTSCTVSVLPNVQAQTSQAQVLSYSWYLAPSTTFTAENVNDLVAVGEIQNTGSSTIGAAWVSGQASDSSGTVLAQNQAQVLAINLASGQKAPFYLDFTAESSITGDLSWVANVSSVTVSISSILNTTGTGSQYDGLVVTNLNGANDSGTYNLGGTITNSGNQGVGDVAVVATFYNSSATVVAVSFADLGTQLTPGQSTTFSVTPWDNTADLANQIANYTVLLQSIPLAATPTPEPTAAPTIQPTFAPIATPTPTQSPAAPQSMDLVYIVIIVVAIVAAIVALVLFARSGRTPAQPSTTPPA